MTTLDVEKSNIDSIGLRCLLSGLRSNTVRQSLYSSVVYRLYRRSKQSIFDIIISVFKEYNI